VGEALDDVEEHRRTRLRREPLERGDEREPHVVAQDRRLLGRRRRRRDVVEGDRIDEVGHPLDSRRVPEVVEAHRRRDAEEPGLGVRRIDELAGSFDGARDRLLGKIVRVGTAAGHAVAMRPQALALPLDGGEDGGGWGIGHLTVSKGRRSGPRRGYGP
jgi:hypothetical protein